MSTKNGLTKPGDVLTWAYNVAAYEAADGSVVASLAFDDAETAAYLAECVRLRRAFDKIQESVEESLREDWIAYDGVNHQEDIELLRSALLGKDGE